MTPYEEMADAIIRKQTQVIGKEIALKRAQSVSGLIVDDEGHVKNMKGKEIEVLEQLMIQYIELLGPAAIAFAKDAIEGTIKKTPGLILPRSLV